MSKATYRSDATSPGRFGDRAARALTECMTVLEDDLEPELGADQYLVVTPTGTYMVDTVAEACDCPDALHRGVRCKHRWRVALATGRAVIPGWVDRSAIDSDLGQHVAGEPRIANPSGRTEVLERDV